MPWAAGASVLTSPVLPPSDASPASPASVASLAPDLLFDPQTAGGLLAGVGPAAGVSPHPYPLPEGEGELATEVLASRSNDAITAPLPLGEGKGEGKALETGMSRAGACVEALHALGYAHATVIGTAEPMAGAEPMIRLGNIPALRGVIVARVPCGTEA